MYFNAKDDTNIDDEFKGDGLKLPQVSSLKLVLIITGAVLVLGLIVFIIFSAGNKLILEGDKEMVIYQGTRYNEPGYTAVGLGNKNKNDKVKINGTVDTNNVGEYKITYRFNLKKIVRNVSVIPKPEVATILHLNGDTTMTIGIGGEFVDPGYSAVDVKDGNLTSRVEVNGTVDTSKAGIYRIVYSVINSDGVTTSETRTIIVK